MHKIGFHARSMKELEFVLSLPEVNLVELKPEKFVKKDGLYFWAFDGERFIPNMDLIRDVVRMCNEKKVGIQLHLPQEKTPDSSLEQGLCYADLKHHDLLLARYDMLGRIYNETSFGSCLTTHAPTFIFNGEEKWSCEEAIQRGREFYKKLGELKRRNKYGFKIGLENTVHPKEKGFCCVGFESWHLDKLLGNSQGIGITVDSGHRNLNLDISVRTLFSYGSVVNCHFHSNPGEISNKNYDDDEHLFATKENLPHYERYIKSFRRFGIPIVLEIGDLMKHPKEFLSSYVNNLRNEIENPAG